MPYYSSFALQTQVKSKEHEYMFLVNTNLLQDSIDKDRVHFNRGDYMFVGEDKLQIDMRSYSFSQHCPFPLFWQTHLSSCCAGSTSSIIDAEDSFSSRRGG
jgi:hypothetical protein